MAENETENTTDQNQAAAAATAAPLAEAATINAAADQTTPLQATTEGDETQAADTEAAAPESTEEITYHAVEKDGQVSAIWEMQGRKHLRTIDPRSRQGQEILRLYTAEHHEETGETATAA